jgi:hypothetical protein
MTVVVVAFDDDMSSNDVDCCVGSVVTIVAVPSGPTIRLSDWIKMKKKILFFIFADLFS